MSSAGDREELAETLLVRCKQCAVLFPAGLQTDRASLEAMVVSNEYRCPDCGCDAIYVKSDHTPVLITSF